ncbi:uncharacterized protein LOC125602285, partial [Brassica napus]|uniref:uncharacterized protein LOC125602285 n=1 Tax=Brassica napus TaxID=3708 RepID=UPI0020788ABB
MESKRAIVIPVTLKGPNYLLWSRLAKTAIGGKGLWSHCISDAPNHSKAVATQAEGEASSKPVSEDRWLQEDLTVLSILQSSLDPSILEAYSYCESAKELWSTLKKIYGNLSNLSRVFEIKKAINNMSQEEEEFTTHLGKFRALWSELEMLRPQSFEPDVLNERREQDKVFGLLLTLSPTFSGLIKHLLRSEKLPTLEEVCAQVQKEEGSHGLFGAKEPLTFASHAEGSSQPMKPVYKKGDRRGLSFWVFGRLSGRFKQPQQEMKHRFSKSLGREEEMDGVCSRWIKGALESSYLGESVEDGVSTRRQETKGGEDPITKKEWDEFVKCVYELVARKKQGALAASEKQSDSYTASKPIIIDSGATHHMISDRSLISDVRAATGCVTIANGAQIPVEGMGNLKL